MVTIESEMFTEIATALRDEYDDIYVSGESIPKPPSFPAVSIVETDNYMANGHFDTSDRELAVVAYEVNVYTNKTVGKKSQAKEITAFIDTLLRAKNFNRLSSMPTPNAADNSIYRVTSRYRAETDGTNLYRYTL